MWLPRNVFHKPHAPTVKMLVEESALTFAILASTSMKESASMEVASLDTVLMPMAAA